MVLAVQMQVLGRQAAVSIFATPVAQKYVVLDWLPVPMELVSSKSQFHLSDYVGAING